jgi:FkbM family methyltransferase
MLLYFFKMSYCPAKIARVWQVFCKATLRKKLLPMIRLATTCVDRSSLLRALLRQVAFPGKGSIVRGLSSLPEKISANCSGVHYCLHLRDVLQREIYFHEFDKKQLGKLIAQIPADGICIDVGANVGFYSLHIAKKLKENGRIYSLEPDPNLFQILKTNCSLNEFGKKIRTYNYALSNTSQRRSFFIAPAHCSGGGSLHLHDSLPGTSIEVYCISLDAFVRAEQIERIDFIKIDVEGFEFEVIEGAHQLMSEQRIDKIYIEFNGLAQLTRGHNFSDFLQLFAKYKYYPEPFNQQLLLMLQKNSVDPKTVVTDFIFVPQRRNQKAN